MAFGHITEFSSVPMVCFWPIADLCEWQLRVVSCQSWMTVIDPKLKEGFGSLPHRPR